MTRDLFIGITEQSKASAHRGDDAHALLNATRWRGAMYMAGYSVECSLRYTADLSNCEDAEDFLDAVDKIRHWIDNNV